LASKQHKKNNFALDHLITLLAAQTHRSLLKCRHHPPQKPFCLRQPQTESAKPGEHLHLTETTDVCLTAKPQLKRHAQHCVAAHGSQ